MSHAFYNGETKSEISSRIRTKPDKYLTEEDRVWLRLEEMSKNKELLETMLLRIGLVKKSILSR